MLYETDYLLYENANGERLNPYSNGICSMSKFDDGHQMSTSVLILILMEYAL